MPKALEKSPRKEPIHLVFQILIFILLFVYLYFLQTPKLTLAQHILSGGETRYSPFISSLILTSVLTFIQELVSRILRVQGRAYLLTAYPSFAICILLTAFTPTPNKWIISTLLCTTLIFALLCISYWDRRNKKEKEKNSLQLFWLHNISILTGILLLAGICSNNVDTENYEINVAKYVLEGDYTKALEEGKSSLATTRQLTALRAYALSKSDTLLAEKLFTYPIPTGGVKNLLLDKSDNKYIILHRDTIYTLLGDKVKKKEQPLKYLQRMAAMSADRTNNAIAKDYWLCALLLEKDLTTFAKELPKYYAINDSILLPKHYQEALLLTENPEHENHSGIDSTTVLSYTEFIDLETTEPVDEIRRANLLKLKKGDTYWWYYKYGRKE